METSLSIAAGVVTILDLLPALIEVLTHFGVDLSEDWSDFGTLRTALLYTTLPQARSVISRVRRHVLDDSERRKSFMHRLQQRFSTQHEDITAERAPWTLKHAAEQAETIKKSYDQSLNIIAVAGAIVAQIAITALSLRDVEQIHWTVEAAFVISLVTGLLSVYYACLVEVKLGSMHNDVEVYNWLTAKTVPFNMFSLYRDSRTIPSYSAALILVGPMQLLNWSLFSLLVGIGIYYGILSSRNESTLRGKNSGIAILLVYVIFTTGAVAIFVLPRVLKMLETTISWQILFQKNAEEARKARMADDNESGQTAPPTHPQTDVVGTTSPTVEPAPGNAGVHRLDSDTPCIVIAALQSSIEAQEASLNAQKLLLRAYSSQCETDSREPQRKVRITRASSDPN